MTRLIDADALLEALKEKRKFENIPQYLQDEYKDMPEVLLRKTLRVDEINDFIANAPTVQREGWVSVPFDLLDSFPEINLGNYGDEEVRNLNNWGIELVNSAAPKE